MAGGDPRTLRIPDNVVGIIYKDSGGVPRLINIICDRALLGAYAENKAFIDAGIVKKAIGEIVAADNSSKISIRKLETMDIFAGLGKEPRGAGTARLAEKSSKARGIAKEVITKLGSTRVKRIVLSPSGTPVSKETAPYQEIIYRADLPQEVQKTLPKLISIIWEGVVLEYKGIRYKERTH